MPSLIDPEQRRKLEIFSLVSGTPVKQQINEALSDYLEVVVPARLEQYQTKLLQA